MRELALSFHSSPIATRGDAAVILRRMVLYCVGFLHAYTMFNTPSPLPKMPWQQCPYSSPWMPFTHFQIAFLVEKLWFRGLGPKRMTALGKNCASVEAQKSHLRPVSHYVCVTNWKLWRKNQNRLLALKNSSKNLCKLTIPRAQASAWSLACSPRETWLLTVTDNPREMWHHRKNNETTEGTPTM